MRGAHDGGGKNTSNTKTTALRAREGGLKVHVKTAHKRSHASTLWLERQLNDPFVQKARDEGFRSRAVYKLKEMDEKHRLFVRGQTIVDLGAAPGGWSQYAAGRVGAGTGASCGKVIALDLLPMEPIQNVLFLQMDFADQDAPQTLKSLLGTEGQGGAVHGVLSDMAANATGHRQTDHLRIVALAEMAANFAMDILAQNGFFLAKVLQGGTEGSLLTALKHNFVTVQHVKPKASRTGSAELYVLARGFRKV